MVSDIMRLHALRYDNVMSCQIVSTVCLHVFIIVLFSLASRTLLRYVRFIACAVHLSSVCLSVVCPSVRLTLLHPTHRLELCVSPISWLQGT